MAESTYSRFRGFLVLWVLVGTSFWEAEGFMTHSSLPLRRYPFVYPLHSCEGETIDTANEHEREEKGGKESLNFHANINTSSDPLPEGTSLSSALQYLRKPESRNVLLSAGGTRPVHEVPISDELEQLWKECCEDYGYEYLPESGDCILACDSVTQFPGVKLVTTVYSGVKQAESESDASQYTFLLVGEEQSVSGVLTGIFNRLTGNDKKGDSLRPSGRAKSVISVVEQTEDGNSLAFNFDASIEVKVEFPAFLLKILPVSKEKAEAQGSASISKAIEKDSQKALKGAYEAFLGSMK